MSDIQLTIGNSPGPWHVLVACGETPSTAVFAYEADQQTGSPYVADFDSGWENGEPGISVEQAEANARLGAAAPELVDVLADLIAWESDFAIGSLDPVWGKAGALLDRLRGGAPDSDAKLPPFPPPDPDPFWQAICEQCNAEADASDGPGFVGWHIITGTPSGTIVFCPQCGERPPEPGPRQCADCDAEDGAGCEPCDGIP